MESMSIVVVGHVDHGKSTLVGRLLADTNSLPQGKLEAVREHCKKNARPFEYAFLLDALKDEQEQGITIDSARVFFQSKKRRYIIIDAPGHVEFLKNMISGASRAAAAVLVIDAKEGIKENSRRHGLLLSMLGVRQIIVCVNKLDAVGYSQKAYLEIKKTFSQYLQKNKTPEAVFIPIAAFSGDNVAKHSAKMAWYKGPTLLEALDLFNQPIDQTNLPLRLPLQSIYKFTENNDARRILAGRIEAGSLAIGDKLVFYPSGKTTTVTTLEEFPKASGKKAQAGESVGITIHDELYLQRGEIACKQNETRPLVGSTFRASLFWMGNAALTPDREYLLKLGTKNVQARITIENVVSAENLKKKKQNQIHRHDIAEVLIETNKPVAFDLFASCPEVGRFVVVDNYDIAGGGIITELITGKSFELKQQLLSREARWLNPLIKPQERALRYGQNPKLILITGEKQFNKKTLAQELERHLFNLNKKTYYLAIGNLLSGLNSDIPAQQEQRTEHCRRFAEVANLLLHAGLIVVATASGLTYEELKMIHAITEPNQVLIISLGPKVAQDNATIDLELDPKNTLTKKLTLIEALLRRKNILFTG